MEDLKVIRSNERDALETADWHTLKSLMSLRRAAVDILIDKILGGKDLGSYVKGALFAPLVIYLVCRTCGYG
jgi:hypothetical protein